MFSQCVEDEFGKEAIRMARSGQAIPVEARYFINGQEKVCAFSRQELKNSQSKKEKRSWEFYDYDIGMYRNTGYKCPVCNIEFGNNIFAYKGIPTFEQEKIPFSYCPICGTKLEFKEETH